MKPEEIRENLTLCNVTEDEEIADDLTGANGHARLIPDDEEEDKKKKKKKKKKSPEGESEEEEEEEEEEE